MKEYIIISHRYYSGTVWNVANFKKKLIMSPDLIQIFRWYKLFLVIDKQGNEVHNILEFCQYI